jgi:hypothetical protein
MFDAFMVSNGFSVLRPISASSIYDRVVEINGQLLKFQIKGMFKDLKSRKWVKVVAKTGRINNYKLSDVDYFAVYVYSESAWFFKKNSGVSTIFVSMNNLNNLNECLDLS